MTYLHIDSNHRVLLHENEKLLFFLFTRVPISKNRFQSPPYDPLCTNVSSIPDLIICSYLETSYDGALVAIYGTLDNAKEPVNNLAEARFGIAFVDIDPISSVPT